MTVAAYDNVVTSFDGFTGFPGMIVDRREVVDPSAALPPGLNYLREEPAAVLTIGARDLLQQISFRIFLLVIVCILL